MNPTRKKQTIDSVSGWNTWDVRSLMTHVLLPEGAALTGKLKEYADGTILYPVIKDQGPDIRPGLRSVDGSYTSLFIHWMGGELTVETAVEGDNLLIQVQPGKMPLHPLVFILAGGMLWNRSGFWERKGNSLICNLPGNRKIPLYASGCFTEELYAETNVCYLSLLLMESAYFSTGKKYSPDKIRKIISSKREKLLAQLSARYGALLELRNAVFAPLLWNTVYDPANDRIITPVTRSWCRSGWVLFEWDTFFAVRMLMEESPELAKANLRAILDCQTVQGFIPNVTTGSGFVSLDRSQPPVGSWVCKDLLERYPDDNLLKKAYPVLLQWNQWWWDHRRRKKDHLLCWGSDPYKPGVGNPWETNGVYERFGALLESGMDNTPLYAGAKFNKKNHLLEIWDTGLNSLYVLDCECVAALAEKIGDTASSLKLKRRANQVRKDIQQKLWSEKDGIFLNRQVSGRWNKALAPTNFLPLLCHTATPEQALRMQEEHLLNPKEFFGKWMLPSISRNDKSFCEQNYWRGRCWPPLNYLVYEALCQYPELKRGRKLLAERSAKLLLKSWTDEGAVRENYNAITGDNMIPSKGMGGDPFYTWGSLLGFIALREKGFFKTI